jgi:hypothetical protein
MSLLTKGGGITKLSELLIDVDKDWAAKGITNLKQLALAMARGDLPMRGSTVIIPFQPGTIGYVCTSAGPGHLLSWAPAGGALKYYFPAPIDLTHAQAIVPVDQSYNKNAPLTREHKEAYLDAPADMIKRLTPAVASVDAELVVPVDQSYNKNVSPGRDIAILVDGAVSETAAGGQTDETAAARDPTTLNDMHLCPMTTVGDKYYLGFSLPFRRIYVYVSTAGAGNWTNQVYFWNGAWAAVADEDDQTGQFMTAATRRIDWTMPVGWIQSIIMGMNLYWIKIETTNWVNEATAPLGAAAWACPVA